jgi:hypothetical protein
VRILGVPPEVMTHADTVRPHLNHGRQLHAVHDDASSSDLAVCCAHTEVDRLKRVWGARAFCRWRNAAWARRLTSARGVATSRTSLRDVRSRRGPALPLAADESRSVISGERAETLMCPLPEQGGG